MKEQEVVVEIPNGEDVRPIALLVQLANKFKSNIFLDMDDKHINAKSIMGMMSLGLNEGEKLTISAEGDDEELAMTEMVKFIRNK